jgi:predicted dehydrogenase
LTRELRVGVVGCGQWGPNHVRNFSALDGVRVTHVADKRVSRLERMRKLYPWVTGTTEAGDILTKEAVDLVVVATPSATHYGLVLRALEAGLDVLCEKPLTLEARTCRELVGAARTLRRVLMVGHVFLFNPSVVKIKEYIDGGRLGRVYYAHSARTNLGPVRGDANVAWDLASHDISIFNYLFSGRPTEVSARGQVFLQRGVADVAFISLVYPKKRLVNIHVSWLDPRKVRLATIVGDRRMVVWDDMGSAEPIRLYDKRIEKKEVFYDNFGEFQLLARDGDVVIPKIPSVEPLRAEAEHMVDCVRRRRKPIADGRGAADVAAVLEAADASLKKGGSPVKVRWR